MFRQLKSKIGVTQWLELVGNLAPCLIAPILIIMLKQLILITPITTLESLVHVINTHGMAHNLSPWVFH
jgi:hypothetical protein